MERKGARTLQEGTGGRLAGSGRDTNVRRGLPKPPLPDLPGRVWGLPAPKTGTRRTTRPVQGGGGACGGGGSPANGKQLRLPTPAQPPGRGPALPAARPPSRPLGPGAARPRRRARGDSAGDSRGEAGAGGAGRQRWGGGAGQRRGGRGGGEKRGRGPNRGGDRAAGTATPEVGEVWAQTVALEARRCRRGGASNWGRGVGTTLEPRSGLEPRTPNQPRVLLASRAPAAAVPASRRPGVLRAPPPGCRAVGARPAPKAPPREGHAPTRPRPSAARGPAAQREARVSRLHLGGRCARAWGCPAPSQCPGPRGGVSPAVLLSPVQPGRRGGAGGGGAGQGPAPGGRGGRARRRREVTLPLPAHGWKRPSAGRVHGGVPAAGRGGAGRGLGQRQAAQAVLRPGLQSQSHQAFNCSVPQFPHL